MQSLTPPYTVPKLVKYDDLKKTWYVFFRYNGKLIKATKGINRIKEYKHRLRAGEALAKAIHERLREGWNPLVPDLQNIEGEGLTFYQALEYAIDKKTTRIGAKTLSGYKCTVGFCKKAVQELNLNYLLISETKRVHIKSIMETMQKQRSWSNAAYNKNLGHLQAVLSELIQWDIIPFNPAHNIRPMPVLDSRANIPPTPDEHLKIKACLEQNHPDFYIFILMIFHTGIRPVEITKITINMIDSVTRTIVLPAGITKTKKERIVPLDNHIWPLIERLIVNVPGDYFLFGSYRVAARGNNIIQGKKYGNPKNFTKDFIPGPTRLSRDTATKRWEKIVKIGLGINVNMYAMKHFGADMKILAGIEISALSELYGHTSKLMTEKYARAVKQVYRQQIVDNSPSF